MCPILSYQNIVTLTPVYNRLNRSILHFDPFRESIMKLKVLEIGLLYNNIVAITTTADGCC